MSGWVEPPHPHPVKESEEEECEEEEENWPRNGSTSVVEPLRWKRSPKERKRRKRKKQKKKFNIIHLDGEDGDEESLAEDNDDHLNCSNNKKFKYHKKRCLSPNLPDSVLCSILDPCQDYIVPPPSTSSNTNNWTTSSSSSSSPMELNNGDDEILEQVLDMGSEEVNAIFQEAANNQTLLMDLDQNGQQNK